MGMEANLDRARLNALAERLAAGDRAAIGPAFALLEPLVRRFCARALPSGGAVFGSTVLRGPAVMVGSLIAGLLLVLAAPWLTRGLAAADASLTRRLLAPPHDLVLSARVAEFYEAKLQRTLDRVVGIAGPAAIIVISLVVGGLIVSVMTALMSVSQIIG